MPRLTRRRTYKGVDYPCPFILLTCLNISAQRALAIWSGLATSSPDASQPTLSKWYLPRHRGMAAMLQHWMPVPQTHHIITISFLRSFQAVPKTFHANIREPLNVRRMYWPVGDRGVTSPGVSCSSQAVTMTWWATWLGTGHRTRRAPPRVTEPGPGHIRSSQSCATTGKKLRKTERENVNTL